MDTINLKVTRKVYDATGVVLTLEYAGEGDTVSGSLLIKEPIDTTVHIDDAYTVNAAEEAPEE